MIRKTDMHPWNRFTCAALVALALTPSGAPAQQAHAGLTAVQRHVMPLVALDPATQDFELLGNAVLVDDSGRLVAPANTLRNLPVSKLLPVSRIGILTPTERDANDLPVAQTRVFHGVRVLHLDDAADLALLKVEGDLGAATPAKAGRDLVLGARARVFGFGDPGMARFVFDAAVAARLPAPSKGAGATRYALDSRVTAAADGGVLFDPATGAVHALTMLHTKSVHRVVHKLADFEYGPAGTALGVPFAEVLSWVNQAAPGSGEEK